MGRYGDIDYSLWARRSFFLGAALLIVGVAGNALGSALLGSLPTWEATLFFDMEVAGVLIGLLAPLTFGVVLPLTE
jgi:hypothetical protein